MKELGKKGAKKCEINEEIWRKCGGITTLRNA